MINNYSSKPGHRGKRLKRDGNWVMDEKKNNKGFWSRKFVEFCERTDLHGYKYIVMRDLNIAERACWAVLVVLSIVCAAYFLVTAYRWYARNPVLTVIETTQAAIWEVPFPAVTICDLNIVSRKAAQVFAKNLSLPANVTAEYVFDILRLAPLLYSNFFANAEQKKKLSELQTIININNISIETLFRKISPASSCNNILKSCKWKNTLFPCDQLFQQVFTMINLCCTFNYFAIDSNVQTSGKEFLQSNTPRHVSACGYQSALTVLINTDLEDYYSATMASQGALVFIDNAYNIPNLESSVRMVNPSTEVLIALTPESILAASGVKYLSPEQRQCYYKDEIKIGKFRHYSFHNCLALQLATMIKHYCQCVPFFIPWKEHHRSCDFNDMACLELLLTTGNTKYVEDNFVTNLTCLPDCEHHDYHFEVAFGTRLKNMQMTGVPLYNDVNLENSSILNVFFNDLVSTRYRRDVYLNWQNILGTFGGLLSLILGFSLLAGVDLILFFVLRIIYDGVKTIFAGKPNNDNKIHVNDITKRERMNKSKDWKTSGNRETTTIHNTKY